jgi:hypothetical protein
MTDSTSFAFQSRSFNTALCPEFLVFSHETQFHPFSLVLKNLSVILEKKSASELAEI